MASMRRPAAHAARRTSAPDAIARRDPDEQTEVPLFTHLRRLWRFEMPAPKPHRRLAQTQLNLYRGH
jgi:hypothetical protein